MEGGREIFTGAGAAAPLKTAGRMGWGSARDAPKWCFALHWHVLRAAQCRRPSTAVPKRREALSTGAFHLAAFYESPVMARSIISWQRW